MNDAKVPLNLKEMPYPPKKKLLKGKEKKYYTSNQTSSESLKVTIQAFRMGN